MMAAKFDLELEQMDVSNAYLNGVLEEEIYMIPPESVGCPKGHVWKLKKFMYGLKQAGLIWNIKLHGELTKMGLFELVQSIAYTFSVTRMERYASWWSTSMTCY
jgi:hypothetical protein